MTVRNGIRSIYKVCLYSTHCLLGYECGTLTRSKKIVQQCAIAPYQSKIVNKYNMSQRTLGINNVSLAGPDTKKLAIMDG